MGLPGPSLAGPCPHPWPCPYVSPFAYATTLLLTCTPGVLCISWSLCIFTGSHLHLGCSSWGCHGPVNCLTAQAHLPHCRHGPMAAAVFAHGSRATSRPTCHLPGPTSQAGISCRRRGPVPSCLGPWLGIYGEAVATSCKISKPHFSQMWNWGGKRTQVTALCGTQLDCAHTKGPGAQCLLQNGHRPGCCPGCREHGSVLCPICTHWVRRAVLWVDGSRGRAEWRSS